MSAASTPAAVHRLEPAMVELPTGTFMMGATDDDKFGNMLERPRHPVTIARRVAVAATPVTVAQWHAVQDTRADIPRGQHDLPMTGVSWDDAIAWCDRLAERTGRAYRLPSEAEWEYAARAGTTTVFYGGDSLSTEEANFLYDEIGQRVGIGRLTPVRQFPPNPWGLFDMLGNVSEWVLDGWHDTYLGAPADGSPRPAHRAADRDAHLRVLRGGAWDHLPRQLRCAHRDDAPRSRRCDNIGFRVALDLPGEAATSGGPV